MSIDYGFNEFRVLGEKAEEWSPMAYRLVSKNMTAKISGFRIGQVLYLHHIKGMSALEIKKAEGFGLHTNMIKGILRGFGREAGAEALEAYTLAMYMIEHEPEMLEKMYQVNRYKLDK
ncbi:hypothetical protein EV207_10634 [Scopulibacillus darangshiensis]|uniref:Uncharacterized protein n=1 Tax=Scopulibacillus darangshiensis TaxID=442528 RepID=A0A4R2P873_9BACL|nr:hypothetical protein [Scopulibacillus darangshiensis]TCP30211.1 hypothetical protein EV207_10634 [Scopulibacillus darangshiensis]